MQRTLLLAMIFFLAFPVSPVKTGDRWRLIMTNENSKHYFDVESIKIVKNDDIARIYLDVWIKVCYNGVGKQIYLESLRKAGISTTGYEDFSYTINHLLFDEGKVSLLGVYDYATTGVILRCFDAPFTRWMDIVPGSVIDIWYDHTLSYALANLKSLIG